MKPDRPVIPSGEGTASLDFFDKVYVINLDRRPDRWRDIAQQLDSIGVLQRATRVCAFDAPGALGCYASHVDALGRAIREEAAASLILEDDALFLPGWPARLEAALQQLPKDWDVLYLGYSLDASSEEARAVDFQSAALLRFPKGCFTTHAYSVRRGAIDRLRGDLLRLKGECLRTRGRMDLQIDLAYLSLSAEYRMYGVYPMAATQRDGYSDIWREVRHYQLPGNIDAILKKCERVPPGNR